MERDCASTGSNQNPTVRRPVFFPNNREVVFRKIIGYFVFVIYLWCNFGITPVKKVKRKRIGSSLEILEVSSHFHLPSTSTSPNFLSMTLSKRLFIPKFWSGPLLSNPSNDHWLARDFIFFYKFLHWNILPVNSVNVTWTRNLPVTRIDGWPIPQLEASKQLSLHSCPVRSYRQINSLNRRRIIFGYVTMIPEHITSSTQSDLHVVSSIQMAHQRLLPGANKIYISLCKGFSEVLPESVCQ